ncbi:hypothetical protein LCGC14_2569890 [marine sediment metagenome]|uniref:Uncharacterized protein n=1 Tax=marine sediment metagenome TaxID=412755 RepID=A0A0F9AHZ8_9ZZZZ
MTYTDATFVSRHLDSLIEKARDWEPGGLEDFTSLISDEIKYQLSEMSRLCDDKIRATPELLIHCMIQDAYMDGFLRGSKD